MNSLNDGNEWRRADALERRTVQEYMTETYREKSGRSVFIIVIVTPLILLISLAVGSSEVKGEKQILSGVVTGISMFVVVLVIYLIRRISLSKKIARIKEGSYRIMITTATDKEHVRGRNGQSFYVEVDATDEYGDRIKQPVSERAYQDIRAGDEIILILYDGNEYGFYGWFDCVPRREHY